MYDAIVIGGGPAGLSAATWLGRYRRRTLVVDADEPRNRWTETTHGYLAQDPVSPLDLVRAAREDLDRYEEVERRPGRATAARREGNLFVVGVDGENLECRRLVLATGVVDVFPEVENFFEHYGRQVFHCPSCDGYEARGQEVVVFGWSVQVAGFALGLLNWARRVTVVSDGRSFEGAEEHRSALADAGVAVVEDEAVALEGRRGDLRGVQLRSGRLACSMAFFSLGHQPVTDLADQLGCRRSDGGYVAVEEGGATSVPGVHAAGDVTPGLQLVQVATGKGTVAGVACALSL